MKARKIDLSAYNVDVPVFDPATGRVKADPRTGEALMERKPYGVRESICNILLGKHRGLNGQKLLDAFALAEIIRKEPSLECLLDDAQHKELVAATNQFQGFGENEILLVKRILEAPEVEVEEANAQTD